MPDVQEGKIRSKDGFLAKYRCRVCRHEFSFNNTGGSPVKCPKCRSIACTALTPTVMVFADSKVVALREMKIDRYKARSLSMLSKLEQFRTMLLSYGEVLELSGKTLKEIDEVLKRAHVEASAIRVGRLSKNEKDYANEGKKP